MRKRLLAEEGQDPVPSFAPAMAPGDGPDTLSGTAAAESLRGFAGSDLILAGEGDDTLAGDGGNDHLEGGPGDDTYLFGGRFGQDAVVEAGLGTDRDQLVFLGYGIADATFRTVGVFGGTNLIVTIGDSTVTIESQYTDEGARIERAVFADGVVDLTEGSRFLGPVLGGAGDDRLEGTPFTETLDGQAANDRLFGQGGADLLIGGAGDDVATGGTGADRYLFGPDGFGADTVADGGGIGEVDQLLFQGFTRDQARFEVLVDAAGTTSLRIEVEGGGSVVVANQYESFAFVSYQVERAVFEDGVVDLTDPTRIRTPIRGTSAADTLVGSILPDTVLGAAGDDAVAGRSGDDTLAGGPGKDTLSGGEGMDAYVFLGRFGQDRVEDAGAVGEADRLVFTGVRIADADFTTVAGDGFARRIVIEGQGSVTLLRQFETFEPRSRIETAVFDDGTVDLTDASVWIG